MHRARVLGSGAFGRVLSVPPRLHTAEPVAVKLISSACAVGKMFEEISAMVHTPTSARLLDFGYEASADEYCIVTELCAQGNLLAWRRALTADSGGDSAALLLLHVFRRIAVAVSAMADRGVVHFDLKCENILLARDPAQDLTGDAIRLGDLGEACVAEKGSFASGVRADKARGTECVQSPELQLIRSVAEYGLGDPESPVPSISPLSPAAAPRSPTSPGSSVFPHQRHKYINSRSDVWSLGCLLFELVTGEMLFNIADSEGGWARFFTMLTNEGEALLLPERRALLLATPFGADVAGLLERVLIRSPEARPSAATVVDLVDRCFGHHFAAHGLPLGNLLPCDDPSACTVTASRWITCPFLPVDRSTSWEHCDADMCWRVAPGLYLTVASTSTTTSTNAVRVEAAGPIQLESWAEAAHLAGAPRERIAGVRQDGSTSVLVEDCVGEGGGLALTVHSSLGAERWQEERVIGPVGSFGEVLREVLPVLEAGGSPVFVCMSFRGTGESPSPSTTTRTELSAFLRSCAAAVSRRGGT